MKYDQHLVTEPWADYELLDSGEHEKLERFGQIVLARPETQALWKKNHPDLWSTAQARFVFSGGKGSWDVPQPFPEPWPVAMHELHLAARLSSFKHVGIFPEQSPNWTWIAERAKVLNAPQVLNLFGYTGAATIAAAQSGAHVTHVDASKQSLDWASENARRSGLPEDGVRWIADDAFAFAKRAVRRGARYDGIILDPPAFGRGAKGEVWKVEEDLAPLLEALAELFVDAPGRFFLLNGYAAGYAARAFAQAVESVFGKVEGESGELHVRESKSSRVVPSGIYARFVR